METNLTPELKERFEKIAQDFPAYRNLNKYYRGLIFEAMLSAYQLDRSEWVSVEDRLPKEGDYFTILVFGSYTRDCPQRPTEVHYYKRGKFVEFRNMDGSRTKNVTHWMPLPQTPNQK